MLLIINCNPVEQFCSSVWTSWIKLVFSFLKFSIEIQIILTYQLGKILFLLILFLITSKILKVSKASVLAVYSGRSNDTAT